MAKYLIYVIFIWGCSNPTTNKDTKILPADTTANATTKPSVDTAALRSKLNSADSVILASHYSPNEPIKDEKTGKYLPHFELIENGQLNESILRERKKLNPKEIKELGNILCLPAIRDSMGSLCFQPRNGVFVYTSGNLSYADICFDCYGASVAGNWGSAIIFDSNKYKKLLQFFKKHGFKYMF